jgi:ATP phosphoribosyltransferase regulatory subunit
LAEAKLPNLAGILAERVAETVAAIRVAAPALRLTVDPVEFRGFRYETGVSVTVYAPGRHEELGRGGRYICGDSEPATGLTLYPDAILRVAPPRQARPRIFVPFDADRSIMAGLRADGFATVAALAPVSDDTDEANRLGCSHILRAEKAVLLHKKG